MATAAEPSRLREYYRLRTRLSVYGRRVAAAQRITLEAAGLGRPCLLVSGGKDSMAMLHLVTALLPAVPAFWIDSGAETPWTQAAIAALRALEYRIETVAPAFSLVEMLQLVGAFGYDGPARLPGDWHWSVEDFRRVLLREPAQRLRAAGYAVHFLGLRGQESRGRLLNRRTRGTIYRHPDGQVIATPLADWEGADVIAYCLQHELPLSAEYLQAEPDAETRERRRTGTALGTTGVLQGRWAHLRRTQPALWQELTAVFPDLRRWG